jgi:hypothetical protein
MRSSRTVRSATRLVTAAALCSALVLPVLSGAGPAGAEVPSVVTHIDSTMGSPKGLLFVPEHGHGSDEK